MGTGTYIKIFLVGIGIIMSLYVLANPDEVLGIFQDRPQVKFFRTPSISETAISVNYSTVVTITARNYDNQDFSDIKARISIIEGENWKEHLDFQPVTKLAEILEPGKTTKTIDIPITAKKLSGTYTPFVIKLELLVNGEKTDEHIFNLKIES